MLRIGDVDIEHPFTQAALSGFSDLPMRRLARQHGASYALHHMVLDRSVNHEGEWRDRLLNVRPDDHPVGAQLMGAEPAEFAQAADALADAGYDVIDINFGCPVPRILGKCRGGFLLGEPDQALAIIREVVATVRDRRPVTVKMRRGTDDTPDSERGFFRILDGAFEAGVAGVTVHGRTVAQRYRGESDWGFLAKVKRHAGDRIVLGSGDLMDGRKCVDMMSETGVDGVTVARGCIGNPWVFAECQAVAQGKAPPAPPSITDQREVILQHLHEIGELCDHESAPRRIIKFMQKYSKRHPRGKQVRLAFQAVQTRADFDSAIDRFYDASIFAVEP